MRIKEKNNPKSTEFQQNESPESLRNSGLSRHWQGHKDSNSGHAVLETAALPTELYPFNKIYYITFGATCQDVFSKFFIFPENFRDVS